MSLIQESPERIYEALKEKLPLNPRSIAKAIPIPDTEEEGYSPIYRNQYNPDGLITKLHNSLDTLYALFEFGYKFSGDQNAFGVRENYLMDHLEDTIGKIITPLDEEETIWLLVYSLCWKTILSELTVKSIAT